MRRPTCTILLLLGHRFKGREAQTGAGPHLAARGMLRSPPMLSCRTPREVPSALNSAIDSFRAVLCAFRGTGLPCAASCSAHLA